MAKESSGQIISIINFDSTPSKKRAIDEFPDCVRCAIIGPSGSGKSNVLMTILMYKEPIKAIYLCSRTAHQEKYKLLASLIAQCNKESLRKNNKTKKIAFFQVTPDTLQPPSRTLKNSILIFDDCLADKQNKIAAHFQHSRHDNNSLFYLTQSYSKIPKKSGIRENFNMCILFKMDLVNLRQIYLELASDLSSFEQFRRMCDYCWSVDKYSFLTMDPENDNSKRRYRRNFEENIDPKIFY
jgi:hypothetical protein